MMVMMNGDDENGDEDEDSDEHDNDALNIVAKACKYI